MINQEHSYGAEQINYNFDIITSVIIEEVEKIWLKFVRSDLHELRISIEKILQLEEKNLPLNEKNALVYRFEDGPSFFKKLLKVGIPEEADKISNLQKFPIPDFIVSNTRNANEISIIETWIEIKLNSDNQYFSQFFAFRLATLSPEKIEPFLRYHLKKSFNDDTKKFRTCIGFILADYDSVLVVRKDVLLNSIDDFFENIVNENRIEPIQQANQNTNSIAPIVNIIMQLDTTKQQNELKEIFNPDAIDKYVEIEARLFQDKFIDSNYVWQKQNRQLVALIYFLINKEYLKNRIKGNTDLNKIFKYYRQFFEIRYHKDIADTAKHSNFDPEIHLRKYASDFYFIERV